MTRSIRERRGRVLLVGAAIATALLGSGCGAGQIAQTAQIAPGVPGVNAQTPDGLFKVRNLTIAYPGPQGYPAGADAPLELALYNDSDAPVTVEISTADARAVVLGGGSSAAPAPTEASPTATPASPTGAPESAGPTGSPGATETLPAGGETPGPTNAPTTPAAPAPAGPARLQIPAAGFVLLNGVEGAQVLRLAGLGRALVPGEAVNLVFDVGGQRIETPARVAVPLTPVPRSDPSESAEGAGHGG